MHCQRRLNGFTLIELLVVISIIGILVALLLPAIQSVREAGRRTLCSNKMKQVSLAVLNFESANQRFPAGLNSIESNKYPSLSWLGQILPYLDAGNRHIVIARDYGVTNNPFIHSNFQKTISAFNCPSDPASGTNHQTHDRVIVATTNYLGVNGTDHLAKDGVFFLDSRTTFSEIKDGTSNTLMVGERPPSKDFWYGWWYSGQGFFGTGSPDMLLGTAERNKTEGEVETYLLDCPAGPYQFERGGDLQCDTLHFWSHHPTGANFSFCDGSVRFLSYEIDQTTFSSIGTKENSETFSAPW